MPHAALYYMRCRGRARIFCDRLSKKRSIRLIERGFERTAHLQQIRRVVLVVARVVVRSRRSVVEAVELLWLCRLRNCENDVIVRSAAIVAK